jgi:putative heme degradation protein
MSIESPTQTTTDPAVLRAKWDEIMGQQPGRFPRDIAWDLCVTEAELMASRIGHGTRRIAHIFSDPNSPRLIQAGFRFDF